MYPLANWNNLKNGYTFGQKTWYNSFHLGIDKIAPVGTPVRAPKDGVVVYQGYGLQGGNTVHIYVAADDTYQRFLHLSKYGASGKVTEGTVIGYVGNTGMSLGAHLHWDISHRSLNLNDRSNFIDPVKYLTNNDLTMSLKRQAEAKFFVAKGDDGNDYIYVAEPNGFPHYVPNQTLLTLVQSMVGRPPVQLGEPLVKASTITGNPDDDWMFDIKLT